MLNNVADALYGGQLNINNIISNVPVKEFIKLIETNFAGKFVFNEFSKSANFLFYNDLFSRNVDLDLTKFLSSNLNIEAPKFKKLILSDNDTKSEDVDEEIETEEIKFDFLKYATIQTPVVWYNSNNQQYTTKTCQMNLINIGDICQTTKNTEPYGTIDNYWRPDNIPVEEFTKIMLAYYDDDIQDIGDTVTLNDNGEVTNSTPFFKYKTSKKIFAGIPNTETNIDAEKILYQEYANFLENSNIKITCRMRIPKTVLNNLDLKIPKLLIGQKVMIESIDFFGK